MAFAADVSHHELEIAMFVTDGWQCRHGDRTLMNLNFRCLHSLEDCFGRYPAIPKGVGVFDLDRMTVAMFPVWLRRRIQSLRRRDGPSVDDGDAGENAYWGERVWFVLSAFHGEYWW